MTWGESLSPRCFMFDSQQLIFMINCLILILFLKKELKSGKHRVEPRTRHLLEDLALLGHASEHVIPKTHIIYNQCFMSGI